MHIRIYPMARLFERKIFRTIYGLKIVDGVYRSRYNFEHDSELNSPNVIGVVKSNRLHYAGHMIRGAEDLPQRVPCRNADEIPKARWADGVNNDSRAPGAGDWTNFARYRVQWRDLLRQVLTKSWF
jgi:hypothetical protein